MKNKVKIWSLILSASLFCSILIGCQMKNDMKDNIAASEDPRRLIEAIIPQITSSLICQLQGKKAAISWDRGYPEILLQSNEKNKQEFQDFKLQLLKLAEIKFHLLAEEKQSTINYMIADKADNQVLFAEDCLTISYHGKRLSYSPDENDKSKFQEIYSRLQARFIPELIQDLQGYLAKSA